MSALIIEAVIKISLIPAAAATVNVLWCRRKSAASKHLVWTLAVVSLLALPVLSAALPRWELPIRVDPAGAPANVSLPSTVPTATGLKTLESSADLQVRVDTAGLKARTTASEADSSHLPWATMLPAGYAVGVFLLLIRLVAERVAVRRLVRRTREVTDPDWIWLLGDCAGQIGVQRPVLLLRTCEQTMPMTVGTQHPAILIPVVADTWTAERRRAVLLHELAHVARYDCLTQLLAAAACAVYWVHPGVWWIARRLRVERELACDDRVLAVGTEAREYAGQLLELAYALVGCRAPALAVSMARHQQLEGRMLAVLDATRNRTTPPLASRLSGFAITAVALIPLATAGAAIFPARAIAQSAPAGKLMQADSAGKAIAVDGLAGTWALRPSSTGVVQLTLSESRHSSHGLTIPIERLDGLSSSFLGTAAGGRVQFNVRRDAGSFAFEGTVRSGVGAGTYTFGPSPSFPGELTRRGFARPTPADQYVLARDDIGFAFLDELTSQNYAKPTLAQLVGAAEHGIHLDHLREMGRLGYRLGRIETLITMVDHGVSPQYVRDLRAQGLSSLSADDLVRARDHGVDPDYISELRTLGYGQLSIETPIQLRDRDVDPAYVRDLRAVGYQQLSLETLIQLRGHGVDPEYVRDLGALGYQQLSLETLTQLRGHGVDPEFIRELDALGYRKLSLETLIRLRGHGVDPEYVRQLKDRGRRNLTVDDLVRLRDQGEAAETGLRRLHELVRSVNARDLLRAFVADFMK